MIHHHRINIRSGLKNARAQIAFVNKAIYYVKTGFYTNHLDVENKEGKKVKFIQQAYPVNRLRVKADMWFSCAWSLSLDFLNFAFERKKK